MANPNKRKGTSWETDGCRFLNRELGLVDEEGRFYDPTDPDNVRRQAQTGLADVGDAWARPFVLEFKNERTIRLSAYVEQAEAEAVNAGLPYGAAVIKRRGKGAGAGYVATSLATFARFLLDYRRLRDEVARLRDEVARLRDEVARLRKKI